MVLKEVRVFCAQTQLAMASMLRTLAAKVNETIRILEEIRAGRVNESRSELLETEPLHENDANHAGNRDTNNGKKNEPTKELITAKPPSSICRIPAGMKITVPPADKQIIVNKLFGNAKIEDVERMAGELRLTMGKKCHLPWLIHYMVISRISNEPDRHDTYLKLIDYLKSEIFDEMIVTNTIKNLRVMLKSKSKYQIFALRNLSKWLSAVTVSNRRSRIVGTNDLTKIQFEVKKCIEELSSKESRKFVKKNRYQTRTFYRSSVDIEHTTELS